MSLPTEIRADSTENLLHPEHGSHAEYLNDAEGNRNRIPLARCSQQAVVATPGVSIEEPHTMMISTDEDTEHIAVSINPNHSTGDSLRSVADLESGDRSFSNPHPLVPYVATSSVPSSDGLSCRHK